MIAFGLQTRSCGKMGDQKAYFMLDRVFARLLHHKAKNNKIYANDVSSNSLPNDNLSSLEPQHLIIINTNSKDKCEYLLG